MTATHKNARLYSTASGVSTVPVLFALSAVILFCFWVLWLSTYVLHRSYVAGETASTSVFGLEPWWPWLLVAGLAWGLLNLGWSLAALKRASLTAFLQHWLIMLAVGLTALGTEAVLLARALTIAPIVIDRSAAASQATVDVASTVAAAVVAGDAEQGQAVFSKTCITCHGPTGQGMPNLAPSLVGSQFIKAADDASLADVIRLGRALGDPNNKSGKVMPARGGNPFLSDEDISHLVAFVRAIQSSPVAAPSGGEVSTLQLAGWVVPSAKRPAAEIDVDLADQEMVGGMRRIDYTAENRSTQKRWLTVLLTIVHGTFLAGVMALSSCILLPQIFTDHAKVDSRLIRLSMVGWIVAFVAWVLIAWLCFWWS